MQLVFLSAYPSISSPLLLVDGTWNVPHSFTGDFATDISLWCSFHHFVFCFVFVFFVFCFFFLLWLHRKDEALSTSSVLIEPWTEWRLAYLEMSVRLKSGSIRKRSPLQGSQGILWFLRGSGECNFLPPPFKLETWPHLGVKIEYLSGPRHDLHSLRRGSASEH